MMNRSARSNMVLGCILSGLIAGCGGATLNEEDVTKIRSLLDKLEAAIPDLPAANTGEDIVTGPSVPTAPMTPTVPAEPDEVVVVVPPAPVEPVVPPVVDVTPPAPETAVASITWTPSNYYENGDPMNLSDVGYYQVIYGTAPDKLTQTAEVGLGDLLRYELQATVGSTYYAAVRTVSIYGSSSDPSNVIAVKF